MTAHSLAAPPHVSPGNARLIGITLAALLAWLAVYWQLEPLSHWAVAALPLAPGSHLADAVGFFIFDTPKVLMLLALVVFAMGVVSALVVSPCVSAPLAGALSKHMDLRLMMACGFGLFAVGLWLNAQLTADSDYNELFLPQAVRGVSLMLCFIPINTLSLGRLPPEKLKNASGLYNLMRNLGGAVGLAAINTLVLHQAALHLDRLGDQINLARPVVQGMIDQLTARFDALGLADPTGAAFATIAHLVKREALVLTFGDCFYVVAGFFLFGLLTMPLVHSPRPSGAGAEAH